MDRKYLSLDVGEKRIGLALGDAEMRMAWPQGALDVDGTEPKKLANFIKEHDVTDIVVGRPRNQKGESTPQTALVEKFTHDTLQPLGLPLHWQDESVTSVIAEQRLKAHSKTYTKADIDAEAAAIILQDFLETL